jgi:hypothetical protein
LGSYFAYPSSWNHDQLLDCCGREKTPSKEETMNVPLIAGISLFLFGLGWALALCQWDFTKAPMRALLEVIKLGLGLIAIIVTLCGMVFIAAGLGSAQAQIFIELVVFPLLKRIF